MAGQTNYTADYYGRETAEKAFETYFKRMREHYGDAFSIRGFIQALRHIDRRGAGNFELEIIEAYIDQELLLQEVEYPILTTYQPQR